MVKKSLELIGCFIIYATWVYFLSMAVIDFWAINFKWSCFAFTFGVGCLLVSMKIKGEKDDD